MYRVLCHKYFANIGHERARITTNSSYVRRSRMAEKQVVDAGSIWLIGNECNINVVGDPLLINYPNFKFPQPLDSSS